MRPDERHEALAAAAEAARRYLDGLDARPVAPGPEELAALARLATPLPEQGAPAREVLAELDQLASPATVASAGPRYFGFVTGGALPAALAANWLAGAWDQNAFSGTSSPAAAALETAAERWVVEALGFPAGTAVGFTTGATAANLAGLAAARDAVLARAGWSVVERGLFGAPEIQMVVGDEVHASLLKALGLLGLGRSRVERVPTDGQGRMRADRLPALRPPAILCLQAGNVNTGAFDPAGELVPRAREAGAWVHADGAFGLWALAAPSTAPLARGFEQVDSAAVDAHKWLNVPYDCGLVLARDGAALRSALTVGASYLPDQAERQPFHLVAEMSRRARGVEVWAALRALGRRGLAELVERCCRHARRFAEGLRAAGFEVLNEVVLNQVLVAFGPDERTRAVIAAVQADGTCWAGGTVWQGRAAMRISVSSWATTGEDVERSLAAIVRAGRDAARGEGSR